MSDQRKQIEQAHAALKQQAEIQQRNLQSYAQVAAIDSQLQQFQNTDWKKFSDDDPVAAQQAYFQYDQLRNARQQIANQISQNEQMTLQERQQEAATRLEEGRKTLEREIKGWNSDMAKQLAESGVKNFGFTEQEMSTVADPRFVKILHDAHQYRKLMNKATAKPEGPEAKPVKSIKGQGPSKKDPNRMSTAEWMEWRNSQVRNR